MVSEKIPYLEVWVSGLNRLPAKQLPHNWGHKFESCRLRINN